MLSKVLDGLLDITSVAPRPFPGEYPTRICLYSTKNTFPFRYYGKPVKEVLDNLRRNYILKNGLCNWLTFGEFDQNGMLIKVEGGEVTIRATFYGLTMPWQHDMRNFLSRHGMFYYLLNRELADVKGKRIYKPLGLEGTKVAERIPTILNDCVRGRVDKAWFQNDEIVKVCGEINEQAEKYFGFDLKKLKAKLPIKYPKYPTTKNVPKTGRWNIPPPQPEAQAPRADFVGTAWGIERTEGAGQIAMPANNRQIQFVQYEPVQAQQVQAAGGAELQWGTILGQNIQRAQAGGPAMDAAEMKVLARELAGLDQGRAHEPFAPWEDPYAEDIN